MKNRNGFVSNSSSCSFTIENRSNECRTLVGFVAENPQLIEQYSEAYGEHNLSQLRLLYSAIENNIVFEANEAKKCIFGNEQGGLIGEVFDYILRRGGQSENFSWWFNNHLR
ncbi:hypothetical protein LCGC14_2688100 [marine sediment metagenome]|uniref:Uncharacterized protein n=1 Tax=marine sediment metagenome TaxID=412755 RepID=A0A0F8ZJF4_9ZZZZ